MNVYTQVGMLVPSFFRKKIRLFSCLDDPGQEYTCVPKVQEKEGKVANTCICPGSYYIL